MWLPTEARGRRQAGDGVRDLRAVRGAAVGAAYVGHVGLLRDLRPAQGQLDRLLALAVLLMASGNGCVGAREEALGRGKWNSLQLVDAICLQTAVLCLY